MVDILDLLNFVDASERPRVATFFGWSSAPRFDVVRLAMDPVGIKSATFLTPRPVDFLCTFRRVSKARFTGRDNALLELLLSAVYEDGRGQEHNRRWKRMAGLKEEHHAIPLTLVRHVLGRGARVSQRDLEQSISRVAAAQFSVPAPYKPRRRTSAKRSAEDQIKKILGMPTAARESGPAFAPLPGSPEAEEDLQIRAGDEAVRREALRQLGIKTKGRTLVPYVPITQKPPKLGPTLVSLPPSQEDDAREDIVSFIRLGVVEDFLTFETPSWLRDVLRSERLVRGRRLPFVHLDLSTIAGFRSPYTAGLFRVALAQSYDVRLGRRTWNRNWDWALSIDDLAAITGYTRQAGGWRAQVLRNVVRPALADFRDSTDPLRIELIESVETRPDAPFVFRLHLRLPDDLTRIAPVNDQVPRSIADLLLPSDHSDWSPGIKAVRKAQAVSKIIDLAALTKAWRIAVDEVHNREQAYYGDVTGNAERRRYRGAGLRELVAKEGAQRAVILFALEEADAPDLMRYDILDRIEAEGTWGFIETDQNLRWGAQLNGVKAHKVDRKRLIMGLEEKCARSALARERLAADRKVQESRNRQEVIAGAKRRYAELIKLASIEMKGDETRASELAAAKEQESTSQIEEDFFNQYSDLLGIELVDDAEISIDDMFELLVAEGRISNEDSEL